VANRSPATEQGPDRPTFFEMRRRVFVLPTTLPWDLMPPPPPQRIPSKSAIMIAARSCRVDLGRCRPNSSIQHDQRRVPKPCRRSCQVPLSKVPRPGEHAREGVVRFSKLIDVSAPKPMPPAAEQPPSDHFRPKGTPSLTNRRAPTNSLAEQVFFFCVGRRPAES